MEEKLRKELKTIKMSFWMVVFTLVLFMAFFLYIIFPFTHVTKFDFSDLNQTEKEFVQKSLKDLDLKYLEGQIKITFVHNLTQDLKIYLPFRNKAEDDLTGGFNFGNGIIFIKYEEDENYLKEVICHEILHSYLKIGDLAHSIVYDLGRKKVCFKTIK